MVTVVTETSRNLLTARDEVCMVTYMNSTEIRNFLLTSPSAPAMREFIKALGLDVTNKRGHKTSPITKEQCSLILLDLI